MRKVSDKIVKNIDHTNNSNTKILNNNKIVLLVTDNIQQCRHYFNSYNINNYKMILIKWNQHLKNMD